jgi:SnoaL-like domain
VSPEEAVRAFFDVYSSGQPERFDNVVTDDYIDYGHTPPGRGPHGARDDYEHAVKLAGGITTYDIDAVVVRDDSVAAAWTGHLPNGTEYRGIGLYRVIDDRVAETRHALIGSLPV